MATVPSEAGAGRVIKSEPFKPFPCKSVMVPVRVVFEAHAETETSKMASLVR